MSQILVYAIVYVVFIAVIGVFAFQSWLPTSSANAVKDRSGILVGVLRCITFFVVVSALQILFPNSLLDKAVWLAAAGLLAIAVVGGVMSWSSLLWLRETQRKRRTLWLGIQSAAYVIVLAFIAL